MAELARWVHGHGRVPRRHLIKAHNAQLRTQVNPAFTEMTYEPPHSTQPAFSRHIVPLTLHVCSLLSFVARAQSTVTPLKIFHQNYPTRLGRKRCASHDTQIRDHVARTYPVQVVDCFHPTVIGQGCKLVRSRLAAPGRSRR